MPVSLACVSWISLLLWIKMASTIAAMLALQGMLMGLPAVLIPDAVAITKRLSRSPSIMVLGEARGRSSPVIYFSTFYATVCLVE